MLPCVVDVLAQLSSTHVGRAGHLCIILVVVEFDCFEHTRLIPPGLSAYIPSEYGGDDITP